MDRLLRPLAVVLLILNAAVLAYVLAAAARMVPTWFDPAPAVAAASSDAGLHASRHTPPGQECDHLLTQLRTASIELHGGRLTSEAEARLATLRDSPHCAGGSEEIEAYRAELATAFREQGREPPPLLTP